MINILVLLAGYTKYTYHFLGSNKCSGDNFRFKNGHSRM